MGKCIDIHTHCDTEIHTVVKTIILQLNYKVYDWLWVNDDFVSVMAIFVFCQWWELFGVKYLLFFRFYFNCQPSTIAYLFYSLLNTSQFHLIFLIINLFRFVLIHRNYFKNDQPQNNPLHSCWFLNRYHNCRRLTNDYWHHEYHVRPTINCWCLPLLSTSHCPTYLLIRMWTQWSLGCQPCLH